MDTTSSRRNAQTYELVGAAMAVHRELGQGFLEGVYQDALEIELKRREIPFVREHPVVVCYQDIKLGTPYRADFLCFGTIIMELKAVKALTPIESAQALHYLKATRLPCALLVNFGHSRLQHRRFLNRWESYRNEGMDADGPRCGTAGSQ